MSRLAKEKEPFNLFKWIRYKYWDLWPYDWRPHQILYRLKCFLFKRYTVIKPRTLKGYGWHDRCTLIPHFMFEILSQFIEKECSPGYVDWYHEYAHKVSVEGKEVYVRDEMQTLYDWWHKIYNKWYLEEDERLYNEATKYSPLFYFNETNEYNPQFKSQNDREQYKFYMNEISELERDRHNKLQEYLHRLVNIVPYLWT